MSIFRTVFILLLFVPTASCIQNGILIEDEKAGSNSEELITNHDLTGFAESYPDCEIWTNWRQTCSRTGEGGEVLCQSSAVAVQPSQTFCVAEKGRPYRGMVPGLNALEKASFNRFCQEFSTSTEGNFPICVRWDGERPFNGKRLGELEHPWCEHWEHAVDPEVNPQLSEQSGFYCASRSIPDWCAWEDGLGLGPQDQAASNDDAQTIPVLLDPTSRVINAPHCRRRR